MPDVIVANNDSASTSEGVAVQIDVIANDRINGFKPNPGQVLVRITQQPSNGTLSQGDDGRVEYTPNSGFYGDDSFKYDLIGGPHISGHAPVGVVGTAYPGYVYLTDGIGALSTSHVSGSLPTGVGLIPGAELNNAVPTIAGSYKFTMRTVDAATGLFDEHEDTVFIVCAPGSVGSAITDTLTIPDDYRSAYIYPLENGNLGVAYAADGVSVGGFYHTREYDSDLAQVGTTVDVEWLAGNPGDSRLWLRGVNEAGKGISNDANSGYCNLFDTGNPQSYFRPSYANYQAWWYAESFWAPEYGGLVWMTDTSLYLGVRKTGSDNPGNVPGYIENTLFKFPLTGSSPIAQITFVSSVGTTTNPRFWMTRARSGNIYVITQDGNLLTYDADLVLQSTYAMTTPVIDSGTTLRGFGVDGDVLLLVYGDGGDTGEGHVEFRNLFTEALTQSISDVNLLGNQATRVLFTDDSCYVQCRNWVGRIPYQPPACSI